MAFEKDPIILQEYSSEECVPPVGEPINQSKNIY